MASRSRRDRGSRKSKLLIGFSTAAFVAGLAATAWSVEAIRNVVFLTGGTLSTTPNSSSGPVNLGFAAPFFGPAPYNTVYVNENGNVTFTAPNPDADASGFDPQTDGPMIAPFFADVETNPDGSNAVQFGQAIVDGKQAFVVNWPQVSFSGGGSASFQLVLTQEPDGSLGVEFNYGSIAGLTGDGPLIGLFPGAPEEGEDAVEPIVLASNDDPVDPLLDPVDDTCTPDSTALVCVTNVDLPGKEQFNPKEGDGDKPDTISEGPLQPGTEEPPLGEEDEFIPQLVADEQVVPEPASALLFGAGLVGLAALRRRRRAA